MGYVVQNIDPTINPRLTNLENNVHKVTYYEIISGASGTITAPTTASINAGEFGLSGNAVLSKIDGSNKPTFVTPKDASGNAVTASLNVSNGNWVASGTYTDPQVAIIYSINIAALNYQNLDNFYIIESEELEYDLNPAAFGGFVNTLNSKPTPIDADEIGYNDTADSNKAKKLTWLQAWTNYFKVKADAFYLKAASNLSDLANIVTARTNLGVGSGYVLVTSGPNFTTPANITVNSNCKIILIGGGAGGGGISTSGISASGGGGGGAVILWISGLTPSTTYTCSIGAGGVGGTSGVSLGTGTAGGNTTLTIGATTYTASGGQPGIGQASSLGGAGGTGTNGTINLPGQNGGDSPGSSASSTDGKGGDSAIWGIGGAQVKNGSNGNVGTGYGAGGSGSKGNTTGGNGTAGVIYAEFFN